MIQKRQNNIYIKKLNKIRIHQNVEALLPELVPPIPNTPAVSAIHSQLLCIAVFKILVLPFFFPFPSVLIPVIPDPSIPPPILPLLPPPAVLGSTFSLALKLTNKENGMSHTQIPKNAEISENEGP